MPLIFQKTDLVSLSWQQKRPDFKTQMIFKSPQCHSCSLLRPDWRWLIGSTADGKRVKLADLKSQALDGRWQHVEVGWSNSIEPEEGAAVCSTMVVEAGIMAAEGQS